MDILAPMQLVSVADTVEPFPHDMGSLLQAMSPNLQLLYALLFRSHNCYVLRLSLNNGASLTVWRVRFLGIFCLPPRTKCHLHQSLTSIGVKRLCYLPGRGKQILSDVPELLDWIMDFTKNYYHAWLLLPFLPSPNLILLFLGIIWTWVNFGSYSVSGKTDLSEY